MKELKKELDKFTNSLFCWEEIKKILLKYGSDIKINTGQTLYDINKDFYIELNDNMVLLYDSYTKFNYKFMYMLAKVWIDSYTIDNDCYTTITFEGDDYTVTSYKRRGKTIHKKPNS